VRTVDCGLAETDELGDRSQCAGSMDDGWATSTEGERGRGGPSPAESAATRGLQSTSRGGSNDLDCTPTNYILLT